MPEHSRISDSTLEYLRNRVAPAALFTYQLLISIVFVALPFLAYEWFGQPLVIGYKATASLQPVYFLHPSSSIRSLDNLSLLSYFWIPYVVGLIYLITSLWVFFLRRLNNPIRIFALFASAAALSVAGYFDHLTSQALNALWISAVALAGGALINLAAVFPEEAHFIRRMPYIVWLAYLPGLMLAGIYVLPLNPSGRFIVDRFSTQAALVVVIFGLSVFLLTVIWRRWNSNTEIQREQSRLILWGSLLSFGLATALGVWGFPSSKVAIHPVAFLPLALFPLTVGNALMRHQTQNTDALLRKAAAYAILTFFAAGTYFLLLSGLSLIFGSRIPANQPFVVVIMILFLAVALDPLRNWIQRRVDIAFSRDHNVYQDQIQAFTDELTQRQEFNSILFSLRNYIDRSLKPVPLHIFLYDILSNQYVAVPDANGQLSTDLHFMESSQIIQVLTRREEPLYTRYSDVLPDSIMEEQNRLTLLGATLYIQMPGQKHLVGWLALGPRQSGEPYSPQDIRFLESLCDQAAVAIERSQVIENLERRVREMDVLTRVAQGVNITPEFDDILELIYAQTNVVIPTQDFRITLTYPTSEGAYHAFYLQEDERIAGQENIHIPPRQGLELLVIQSQLSLVTDEFERECRSRGIVPDQTGIFAWMGVPLNAGAQTIGTISLGSRNPLVVYTEEQCALLQAIADQAAGAIIKSRLLAESQKHALQLATLNEVGRSLTSTLEIKPLLTQILNNACSILNCEAGSLFLVDDSTSELIFEVTAGPVADDLVGKRLAPGTGVVGRVAELGQPLIVNNVKETSNWFEQPDEQTGFYTRDLMAVPMMLKESTIGVIELINKRDGSPFTQDDEELLSTLSSQAAIAIENAQLYTQTDEALNARLEEMSVMQRIDRELNTSLDADRTMRIALDWSMNQSHAEAGLIGFLEESEREHRKLLRVIASKGFPKLNEAPDTRGSIQESNQDKEWVDLEVIQKIIQDGQPHRVSFSAIEFDEAEPKTPTVEKQTEPVALLASTKSQAIIPIRRKSDVIGLLLLESTRPDSFSNETITFLTRLSDHAAIAISNALLYADLQSANIAKSEFVSLVSHELKTPMTSIRGYTDLLAQGTVGPVNEIQANFLNTIRSNVNRMANLVSDLADISRIEAGRLHLEFQAISIQEILDEVIHSAQAQIDEKEHSLDTVIPGDLPKVWGDLNRLIQVMNNLVSNAIKYTPQNGHIIIQSELTSNQWDPDGAPEVVHIFVADNGLGISMEDQEKMFQKFFRSADQNVRDLPGTGLGLNITRHLVEMQGGRIWFETELGHGSVFHYTIPVAVTG